MATTNLPINPELSAVAILYKNPDVTLIADKVLPRVQVGTQNFNYTKYTAAQGYTVPDTKIGRKGIPQELDFGGALIPSATENFGLDSFIPQDDIDNYVSMLKPVAGGPVEPSKLAAMLLSHLVQIDRERRVASLIFGASTYGAGLTATLSGTSQFSDYANSDPIYALNDYLDRPLIRPNVMVLGQSAWTRLRSHPKVNQALNASAQNSGIAARGALADLLELKEIVVGASFINTARPGQAPNMQRVWGKHIALLNVSEMAAQMDQPTFGWTAQFGSKVARMGRDESRGLNGGEKVRVGESVKEVISANDLGFFIQNAVA